MDVLIVGAGAMGTWFGRSIDASVTFADVDPDSARTAADAVGGDVAPLEGEERYDAVCLAVPMGTVERAIDAHAHRATRAVLDVSGVMAGPLAAMAVHAPERERVSLHPLFAPARAPGSIPVVRDRPGPVTDALLAALRESGNELVETSAAEHDEAMETVQATAHAAVLSFSLAAESVPPGFETSVYRQLRSVAEQVTDGNPRVYADIQRTFDGAGGVADAARAVADADDDGVEALYRDAAAHWHGGSNGGSEGNASNEPNGSNGPTGSSGRARGVSTGEIDDSNGETNDETPRGGSE